MRRPFTSLALSLIALQTPTGFAATARSFPTRLPVPTPRWVGERHELTVSYLGFSAIHMGVEILPLEEIQDRKTYHLHATATNSGLLGLFYKIDNTVDSASF